MAQASVPKCRAEIYGSNLAGANAGKDTWKKKEGNGGERATSFGNLLTSFPPIQHTSYEEASLPSRAS